MSEQFPHQTSAKLAFAPSPAVSSFDEIEQHIILAMELARQKPGFERALTSAQLALEALQIAKAMPTNADRTT